MVVRILAAEGPAAFVLAVVGSWLLIVAAIAAPLLEARPAGLLLILPLVVDGTGQLAGLWASTNASRTITGILAGLGLVRLGLAVARLGAAPAAPGRAAVLLRRSVAAALAALLVATGAVPAGSAADGGRVTLKSGTPGALEVYVSDVEAVDGQLIPLSARQEAEGENKGSTAAVTGIVLGVLCLPSALWGFAIKGDEGRIPPGAEVKAFTDAEAYIRGR